MTQAEIAQTVGLSRPRIANLLKIINPDTRTEPRSDSRAARNNAIRQTYAQGHAVKELAKLHKLSRSQIHRIVKS